MVSQKPKNFNLGILHRTKVTASSGLFLVMTFAHDIGLGKKLERLFSHLKLRERGYQISTKMLSFIEMIIKGGDRLSDIDVLRADPGLLDISGMKSFPRPNTLGDFARRFSRRDVDRLAEVVMRMACRAIGAKGFKEVVLDLDSTLIASDVQIAKKSYEGYRGFNPLLGMLRAGGMSWAAFSLFRPGNAAPQANNLSLLRKISRFVKRYAPGLRIKVRIDSAGYNHRIMRYCDRQGHDFVIAGEQFECILDIIKGIEDWEPLRGGKAGEEVGEGVHFVGPEKEGAAYRFVTVRRRKDQGALFPEFEYTYRLYFTNTDWDAHTVVHFYRKRGDAENTIKELKEGFALDHILSEDFLASAVFFQLQLLAYNLVQYFKSTHLERAWWTMRIKRLRYRLINIAGVIIRHSRKRVLRLSVHYKYLKTFRAVFHSLHIRRIELRI